MAIKNKILAHLSFPLSKKARLQLAYFSVRSRRISKSELLEKLQKALTSGLMINVKYRSNRVMLADIKKRLISSTNFAIFFKIIRLTCGEYSKCM
jgi:hypothetical protein